MEEHQVLHLIIALLLFQSKSVTNFNDHSMYIRYLCQKFTSVLGREHCVCAFVCVCV
jgi:hypothetical protein